MEYTTHNMTQEQLQRIAYITHIHEAAAKSKEINEMLIMFYRTVCTIAKLHGIQLSTLQIPHQTEEDKSNSVTIEDSKQNDTFYTSTT